MSVTVRLSTRNITRLIADLSPQQISQLLRRCGFEGEGEAKKRAPVDTGFLRNSIGTRLVNPREVWVGASAKYAPFVERGTRRSKAQPYLEPGVMVAVKNLEAALEARFKRAK